MSVKMPQVVDGSRLPEYFLQGVQEAVSSHNLQLSDFTEFYLVNLLTGFEKVDNLFSLNDGHFEEEPLAVRLSRALTGDTASQIRELKKLGDVALYFSSFFVDHIERGVVGREYYVGMGSGAYASLAGCLSSEKLFEKLYSELSENFGELATALGDVSIAGHVGNNVELLNLYERWLKTGNEKIREKLIKEGLIPTRSPSEKPFGYKFHWHPPGGVRFRKKSST